MIWIFEWTTKENLSLERIAEKLTALGAPKHRHQREGRGRGRRQHGDHTWRYGGVSRIVRNEIYTGRYTYKPHVLRVPALIDAATFKAAERAMVERRTYSSPDDHTHYFLRGMGYCVCGSRLVGVPQYTTCKGRTVRNGRFWYVCRAKFAPKRHGGCPYGRFTEGMPIDQLVWRDMLAFIKNAGQTLERVREEILEAQGEQQSLDEELDVLKARVGRKQTELRAARRSWLEAKAALDEGRTPEVPYSDAEYAQDRAAIEAEITQIREEIAGLEAERESQVSVEEHLAEAQEFLAGLSDDPEEWGEEKRRDLVETMVDRVTLGPNGVDIDYVFTARRRNRGGRRGACDMLKQTADTRARRGS